MSQTNPTDTHAGHPRLGQMRNDQVRGDNSVSGSQSRRARFRIEGIASSFDAERLERRLERQVGVVGATVNPIVHCAYIAYDASLTSPSLLVRQIELSGFQVMNR